MIEEDSQFDCLKLVYESSRIPQLISKYNILLVQEKFLLERKKIYLQTIRRKKLEYFLGQSDDEVYKQNPLHIKVHRNDLETYLMSDEEYQIAYLNCSKQDMKVSLIENILSEIKNRSYHIKEINITRNFEIGV